MNYLAIDTSGEQLTIVIKKDGKIYTHFEQHCGVNHSVSIMPAIEKLASDADFDFKSADFVACVVGAGSFTGIRIGIATAKAIAFAFNLKVLSITSFDCIAYNRPNEKILAVIDAKHNGYYVCGYDNCNVTVFPQYMTREQVTELAKDYTLASAQPIEDINAKVVSVCEGLVFAVESKKAMAKTDINSLLPLYVRKSQAEEGR